MPLSDSQKPCEPVASSYQYTQEQRDLEQQKREQLTEGQPLDEQMMDEWYVHKQDTMLPRWLADGFWYLSHFVEEWTSHPSWEKKRAREPNYFQKAYERLYCLACWFFEGEPPWNDVEQGWASTLIENQSEL